MTLLDAALEYLGRGWSVIRIGANKKATVAWRRYQKRPPTKRTVRRWFKDGTAQGVAVVCGLVSGGLAVRDFDLIESYERWAAEHPELAKVLPTVKTTRGMHVYFIGPEEFHNYGDGEYRGTSRQITVLPPSRHPDGRLYRWINPLPDGPLPVVDDPVKAGLYPDLTLPETRSSESGGMQQSKRSKQKQTEQTNAIPRGRHSDDFQVKEAIEATLPDGPGKRNRAVFNFARHLKALPHLADAPVQMLRPNVREWHRRALPVITTKPFDETWLDFMFAWKNVKVPIGSGPLELAAEAAKSAEPPPEAEAYDISEVRLLVSICRELQRYAGDGVFFLACRTAQRLLGIERHETAWRWLLLLEGDGLLHVETRGNQKSRRATRYRYTGQL